MCRVFTTRLVRMALFSSQAMQLPQFCQQTGALARSQTGKVAKEIPSGRMFT